MGAGRPIGAIVLGLSACGYPYAAGCTLLGRAGSGRGRMRARRRDRWLAAGKPGWPRATHVEVRPRHTRAIAYQHMSASLGEVVGQPLPCRGRQTFL